jgi:hypothetical protein
MWATIFNLLTGNVFKTLTDLYSKKLDAENASERLAADVTIEKIKADNEATSNAKEVRLATAGFWEMRTVTFLIAAPFVLHLWAVGLDTVFRFGWRVPAFPNPFDQWEGSRLLPV